MFFSSSSAPAAALLVNSCVIAIRSILSKFVTGDELGKFFIVQTRSIACGLQPHTPLQWPSSCLKKIAPLGASLTGSAFTNCSRGCLLPLLAAWLPAYLNTLGKDTSSMADDFFMANCLLL